MSALGMLGVALKAALRHGFRHPGRFEGRAGDGHRPFLSTDVGSQEQREANVRRLEAAVANGAFPSIDAAKDTTEVLGRLLSHDELGAQMHLEMALVAHILTVQLRRFHTSGAARGAEVAGEIERSTAGDSYERESYLDAFLVFVDDTRGDHEMEVWNHLVFDLLLNECGSHKIVKSLVRVLVAPYERSERRNAIALAHSAVSFGGHYGGMQPLDALQEEYVYETKEAMPKTASQRNLHSTLFKRGLNLGLGLRLIPYRRHVHVRQGPRQALRLHGAAERAHDDRACARGEGGLARAARRLRVSMPCVLPCYVRHRTSCSHVKSRNCVSKT